MATIAKMYVEVNARLGSLVKDLEKAGGAVADMSQKMKAATANVKGLEYAQQALSTASKVLNDAQSQNATNLSEIQAAFDRVKNTVANSAKDMAESIGSLPPTMEGFQKACEKLSALQELSKTMENTTGDTTAMAAAMAEAQDNLNQLSDRMNQAKINALALNAVFYAQGIPLLILAKIGKEIYDFTIGWLSNMDAYYNGVPGKILKIVTVLVTLLALIGYCASGTIAWGVAQTYLLSIWKTNIIVIGLTSVSTLTWSAALGTSAWLIAQLGLNKAWTYFLAATGVGLILVVLAAIVMLIYQIVQYFSAASDQTEKLANQTNTLQTATAKYKDNLRDINNEYKTMFDTINKIREASKTPAMKAVDRENELQTAINAPAAVSRQIAILQREMQNRNKLIDAAIRNGDDELLKNLQERNTAAADLINDLTARQNAIKPLSQAEIASQRAANIQAEMGDRDISKYLPQMSALDEAARAQKEINEMFAVGKITMQRRDEMIAKVQETFEANDEATKQAAKAAADLAKQIEDEKEKRRKIAEDYQNAAKSPLGKFIELADELDKFQDVLNVDEYQHALAKLQKDLVSQLGIEDYLKPADSLEQTQKSLATALYNIQTYYESGAISMQEMLDAQNRATESFQQQGEMGALLKKAQEALIPEADRIAKTMKDIDAYADAFGVSDDLRKKMKELTDPKAEPQAEGKKDTAG